MAVQRIYPWDKWLRRRKITLKKNVDFFCQPHSMSVMIRNRAKDRDIEVSVYIDGNHVTIERR